MIDNTSLFKIGYGLYVATTNDGEKQNGCIVNTVVQLTQEPIKVAVAINKANYTHDTVKATGKVNINCLTENAPFSVFERFGFKSGRDTDKFSDFPYVMSDNGVAVLTDYINAYLSLYVTDYIDMGSHGLFICTVTETKTVSNEESMTYSYYHKFVKPQPQKKKKGYTCKICGYTYEGETLPQDFICPLCKHPASDFEPMG